MDTARIVQKEAEKEIKEDVSKEYGQLNADLRDAHQLLESFVNLEKNIDWQVLNRIILSPAIEQSQRNIDRYNKELRSNPAAASQLIYWNAFRDILTIMTDFKSLQKKWTLEIKQKSGRLKELEKKLK